MCKYILNGKCLIASSLCGGEVYTNVEACRKCASEPAPFSANSVTGSLATSYLIQNRLPLTSNAVSLIDRKAIPLSGVGTELKKLISWFPIPKKSGCRSCRNLEAKMNRWGPDRCEAKIEYIVGKLRIAAKRRGIPFIEWAVRAMVQTVIRAERERVN